MDKIALFVDYLKNKPGDRFAMYSLALEYRKAGRAQEAVEILEPGKPI